MKVDTMMMAPKPPARRRKQRVILQEFTTYVHKGAKKKEASHGPEIFIVTMMVISS